MIFNLYLCTKFGAINSLLTIKTNKTLTEILMRSDFAIKVSFYDIKGKAITLKKFKLSYSTQLSTPIIATFDGTTYSDNCTPTDNGVIIQFNNPMLNIGILKVIREFTIESSVFSDGVRDIRQQETLPIEIVQSYSRSGSQAAQPTSITSPQDDLLCIDNVILDSRVGPKGDSGGTVIDHSLLIEQKCEGEFWNIGGVRKQVYTRTFIGTTPKTYSSATQYSFILGNVGASMCQGREFLINRGIAYNVSVNYMLIYTYASGNIEVEVYDKEGLSTLNCPYTIRLKYAK